MPIFRSALAIATLSLLVFAAASAARAGDALPVCVTAPPQAFFVKKIGGDLVDVTAMVPPGADPHSYEPKPGQMRAVARAKAYFALGDAFEDAWLSRLKSANPDLYVVPTQEGIERLPMAAHSHGHDEAAGEEHKDESANDQHEAMLDPHIWLDPNLVKIQAENIEKGLAKADPAHAERYEANLRTFLEELTALDAKIRDIFAKAPRGERAFIVFHPSWGYFARAYGLKQIPIEVEGAEPSPKELAEIIEHARENKVKVIFVQPQLSEKSARTVAAETGADIVRLDPLAENWDENLLAAATAIEQALR